MIFRKAALKDLEYIFRWLKPKDYLRFGVLRLYIDKGNAYTVELDGKPIAISIIHPVDNDGAWLMGARVEEGYRGRGVGKYMTSKLVEEAYRRGFRWVALMTSVDNKPVHKICRDLDLNVRTKARWISIDKDKVFEIDLGSSYRIIHTPKDYLVEQLYNILSSKGVMIPIHIELGIWSDPDRGAIRDLIYRGWTICLSREGVDGGIALVNPREDRYTWYIGSTVALIPHLTERGIRDLFGCIAEQSIHNHFNDIEVIIVDKAEENKSNLENIYSLSREKPWEAYIFYKKLR